MFDQLTQELVLKAVMWDEKKGAFVSPSYNEFVWQKDGIESATCKKETCTPGEEPPYEANHIPGDECYCGLYGTFRWRIIGKGYTKRKAISPIVLVEVAGKTSLYEDGARSFQQCIRGVINTWDNRHVEKFDPRFNITSQADIYGVVSTKAASVQAVDYFQVPMLDRKVATIVMDLQNIRLNKMHSEKRISEDDFHYLPEDPRIRQMDRAEVDILMDTYLPQSNVEVEWSELFKRSG
jgi:hypothetical protein